MQWFKQNSYVRMQLLGYNKGDCIFAQKGGLKATSQI